MVEINTVFQQLVQVLDKIDPAKLNQTLGAIATAFNGRGEKFGKTLTDFNAFLAKIEPSLPNLSHDIEAAVPTLSAYADAAPDLVIDRQEHDADQQFHRRRATEPRRVPGQLNRFGRRRKRRGRRQPPGADRRAAPTRAHHRPAQPVSRGTVVRHRRSRPVRELAPTSSTGHRRGVGRPHARSRTLSLSGRPAEGRRQGRPVLQGTRPAQRCPRVSAAVHRR